MKSNRTRLLIRSEFQLLGDHLLTRITTPIQHDATPSLGPTGLFLINGENFSVFFISDYVINHFVDIQLSITRATNEGMGIF